MKIIEVKCCGECPILSIGCYIDNKFQYSCWMIDKNEAFNIVEDIKAIHKNCPLPDKKQYQGEYMKKEREGIVYGMMTLEERGELRYALAQGKTLQGYMEEWKDLVPNPKFFAQTAYRIKPRELVICKNKILDECQNNIIKCPHAQSHEKTDKCTNCVEYNVKQQDKNIEYEFPKEYEFCEFTEGTGLLGIYKKNFIGFGYPDETQPGKFSIRSTFVAYRSATDNQLKPYLQPGFTIEYPKWIIFKK